MRPGGVGRTCFLNSTHAECALTLLDVVCASEPSLALPSGPSSMRVFRVLTCLAALLLVCGLVSSVSATCPATASRTYDAVPVNPGFSQATRDAISALTSNNFTRLGCSEKVKVFTQSTPYTGPNATLSGIAAAPATWIDGVWPRQNCPHLQSGLTPFENVFSSSQFVSGADITVAAGQQLLLRGCALPAASQTDESFVLRRLTVANGATLVLDDSPLVLRVREIVVSAGGALLAGSSTCRLYSKVKIVFVGSRADSSLPSSNPGAASLPSKGLLAYGRVDVHGKEFFPTWTRLARAVEATGTGPAALSNVIFLQEAVNWEVGQQVMVTTSVFLDCNSKFQAEWCKPCEDWESCPSQPHQNEVRTIVALGQGKHLPSDSRTQFSALQLDAPLTYAHYAGAEYQVEVALLSRRIEFVGSASGDQYGAQLQVTLSQGEGRFAGASCTNCGQLNELGRYPFHFHMLGDTAGSSRSYVSDCAVIGSQFRAYVIHGSNHTRLSRNVGYDITGMAVYLEDGVEENNLLEYNLMAFVHPIFQPANGGWGQGGETFLAQTGLLIPADTSAAGFYALNAHNAWIGNAASGGWSGFVWPNAPTPIGDYRRPLPSDHPTNPWQPMNRPLLRFVGNSAHSSGAYWDGHGSCAYVGAWLDYDGNTLRYNSGRNNRNTRTPDGNMAVDVFEHSKFWFCNKGFSHWGDSARFEVAEMHDVRVSAMLFGSSSMVNVLVNGKTPNQKDTFRVGTDKIGFQFCQWRTNTEGMEE